MRSFVVVASLCTALLLSACSRSRNVDVAVNSSPQLVAVGNQLVVESNTLTVDLMGVDGNAGDALSFEVTPTLSFAVLTDNGDGTAAYVLTPGIGDAGAYPVNIRVVDNGTPPLSHAETIIVSIPDIASVPVIGFVKDASTLLPLEGAIVTLQATPFQAVTGYDGSFEIYVPSGVSQVIVGAMRGYFNASLTTTAPAPSLEILVTPVPLGTNANYAFVDPSVCGGCHPNQEAEWNDTPMAKAGTNTWVHDIYAGNGTVGGMGGFVYTRDSVFAASNQDSECASCHQPETWVAAGYAGRMDGPPDPGYPSSAVGHGISCETCHKIADVDVTKIDFPGLFPGAVDFNLPDSGQVQYGPYPDSDYSVPGFMVPAYQPQLAAEVCGVCHQDKNDINEDHTFAGVTSEPTYTEWAESAFGDPNSAAYKSCVDCHMPPTQETQACINISLERDPQTIRSHTIQGTTPAFLDNAVELSMQTSRVGTQLQVSVSINNSLTGHHVPTGVTIRNMILLVQAWEDGNDPIVNPLSHTGSQTIHTLGGVGLSAQGYYSGLPGKFYAKVNHDANLQGPTFFTDATGIMFDSRIPALATDTTNYSFALPASGTGNIRIRARLIYRRAFRFLVDAKGWTTDGHGNPLEDLAAPHFGHLMEEATATLGF